jgi:hypothetical protein
MFEQNAQTFKLRKSAKAQAYNLQTSPPFNKNQSTLNISADLEFD